jgi:hypothetical protein
MPELVIFVQCAVAATHKECGNELGQSNQDYQPTRRKN